MARKKKRDDLGRFRRLPRAAQVRGRDAAPEAGTATPRPPQLRLQSACTLYSGRQASLTPPYLRGEMRTECEKQSC